MAAGPEGPGVPGLTKTKESLMTEEDDRDTQDQGRTPDVAPVPQDCHDCFGTGRLWDQAGATIRCPKCDGSGIAP